LKDTFFDPQKVLNYWKEKLSEGRPSVHKAVQEALKRETF